MIAIKIKQGDVLYKSTVKSPPKESIKLVEKNLTKFISGCKLDDVELTRFNTEYDSKRFVFEHNID